MSTDALSLVELPLHLQRSDLVRKMPSGNRFLNITGQTFGRCICIGFAGFYKQYSAWLFKCECGQLFVARSGVLKYRGGQTCGCSPGAKTHGLSGTVWADTLTGMKSRCYDTKHPSYKRYGGRGIKICRAWRESVEQFAKDIGERPSSHHSIDRIDNDGHYSCGRCDECVANGWLANCRWATLYEQLSNKSSGCLRLISHRGSTKPMTCWANDIGISRERMRQRVNRCEREGIDIAEAIDTPAGETMPSLRNKSERYHLRISERNRNMVSDEWFDGNVHVLKQGESWSGKIACETFREIIQAEAVARGGKCKFRILEGHIMFAYYAQPATRKSA